MTQTSVATGAGQSHPDADHGDHGDTTVFGFWIYLMTDCILFGTLFAAFAVMRTSFAGGPTGKQLFEIPGVAYETAALLLSSITYGFAMLAAYRQKVSQVRLWLVVTFILGLCFLTIEIREFAGLIAAGNGPDRSAFLSIFFTLVGTHGLHVTCGIIWLVTLMTQVSRRGLNAVTKRRLMCLSLFWHFLDVIWIGVFSFVYLIGAM